ncbi:Uncharacterised protein [Rhodococcus wratislaviensis]|uniref:Uncharacterized protein n=1 Tax=Rhodococcus wratislaviensis TaxID=44752 RepID=A0AB38F9B1_RHOWR|nr:Uncharacterised protein [Rhodococcus wratislaviensis]
MERISVPTLWATAAKSDRGGISTRKGTAFDTKPGVRRAAPTRLATANRIMNSDMPDRRWKSPATAAARNPGIGIPIDSAAVSHRVVSSSGTVWL